MVERNNGFFETSFLPGRAFASPADFNTQLGDWLTAGQHPHRPSHPGPSGGPAGDRPPGDDRRCHRSPRRSGCTHRIRLARDYYVRVDTNDYSVDPRVIGRFVDVTASPTTVEVFCDGQLVARHDRSWANHGVVTDPAHVATAHQMRLALAEQRRAQQRPGRAGPAATATATPVAIRALPDYDALFGVDFNPDQPDHDPTAATAAEASNP